MRNFLVKNFAFYHMVRLFGKSISWLRAANFLFPTFLVGGVYSVYTNGEFDSIMGILILIWTAIMAFFGFVYFRIRPAKWAELDKDQKFQYGEISLSSKLNKLSAEEMKEWQKIKKEHIKKIEKSKFYNVKAFLVNVIALILAISALIIIL